MEWVEAVGKTVDEATEQALDQLGVAYGDAEIILVSEPKPGLFGRMRGEARVRVRVRPVGARPKRDRSRKGGRSGQGRQGPQKSSPGSTSGSGGRGSSRAPSGESEGSNGSGGSGEEGNGSSGRAVSAGAGTSRSARRRRNRSKAKAAAAGTGDGGASASGTETGAGDDDAAMASAASGAAGNPNGSSTRGAGTSRGGSGESQAKETEDMAEGMTLEEQGEAGRAFLAGLLSEYGIEASVEARLVDEDTVEIAATGEDLGVLVGPRGSTLSALQDLTRAVVQRQCPSRTDRILVDVAGYRERRSAALKRFSVQIAEEVLASGQERALEAMSPADRKAVHDAVNEMDGVATRSEGEDPHRYIVIAPAS